MHLLLLGLLLNLVCTFFYELARMTSVDRRPDRVAFWSLIIVWTIWAIAATVFLTT